MKRITKFAAVMFVFVMLGVAYSQSPKVPAPKKVLVKSLPKGIQGVELVANGVRVKSGFKWVKQANGAMTVAAMRGGGGGGAGLGGSWDCSCTAKGGCKTTTSGGYLFCTEDPNNACKGECRLTVTTTGFKGGVIAF